METTLIVHLIGAPIITFVVSAIYYRKFNYTSTFQTALVFLLFVLIMDAGLVAPVFEKSFEMFRSVIGTWLPFSFIFMSAYLAGAIGKKKGDNK